MGKSAVAELLQADADLVAEGAHRQVVRDSLIVAPEIQVGMALAVSPDVPGHTDARRDVPREGVAIGRVARRPGRVDPGRDEEP